MGALLNTISRFLRLLIIVPIFCLQACSDEIVRNPLTLDWEVYPEIRGDKVRNIIFIMGDGMGVNQVKASRFRYYGDEGRLHMERLPHQGLVRTTPADSDKITDSAAGATAFATGHKAINRTVGIDADNRPRLTILEAMSAQGYATGIITTSELTDASPASFYAHHNSRYEEEIIVEQLSRANIDLLIGAPGILAKEEGSVFMDRFNQSGHQVISDDYQLNTITKGPVLGLIDSWGSKETDLDVLTAEGVPTLRSSVAKAIEILSDNKQGFFLFVEDEGIDTGGHRNLSNFVLNRVKHLDDAVAEAVRFALQDRKTLVIVTADHETGGVLLEEDGEKLMMLWSGSSHSNQDVPIYAIGPGAEIFTGNMDNTEVAHKMGTLLKLHNFPEP